MERDDLLDWDCEHEAAIRWGIDDFGRQVIEVSMTEARRDGRVLRVAANAPVTLGALVDAAMERLTSDQNFGALRAALKAV